MSYSEIKTDCVETAHDEIMTENSTESFFFIATPFVKSVFVGGGLPVSVQGLQMNSCDIERALL